MSKKINILKYAKFQGLICAFVGLLLGFLYSFGGLAVDALVSFELTDPIIWEDTPGLSKGTLLAFIAIIVMPIYFGILGFIFGIFGAFLFNKLKHPFKNIDTNFKQENND